MLLSLKNNKGFSWYANTTVSLKGYFFDVKNTFLEKEEALSFLKNIKTKEDFLQLINTINGCFTIIIRTANTTFVASDTSRVFPIFYTFKKGEIHLSDDISYLKKIYKLTDYDALAEVELKSSLHTYGKKTLLKNVYQIQSNE